MLANIADKVKFEFEQTFMFYLPRICEHCLNPSCAASCPSGAIYKRSEDGIVLVDQDRCRGWRMCVSGCPYKKVYFNHRTGKAEKCTFCFPRVEVGLPDRLLGDLRRPAALHRARAVRRRPGPRGGVDHGRPGPLRRPAQRLPRPARPRGGARGRACRHPAGLGAGGAAVAGLGADQQVPGGAAAAPGVPHHADGLVHPAAVARRRRRPRHRARRRGPRATCSPPSTRCASRSSTSPSCSPPATPHRVDAVLRRLAAMRSYMREITMGRAADESIAAAVGMTGAEIQDMYRLLAIAKYDERYVIPPAHAEQAHSLEELATECSLDYEGGPGMGGSGPFGEGSGAPTPIAVENFQMLQDRQTSDTVAEVASRRGRVNLLNWDGRGHPDGLFPPPDEGADARARRTSTRRSPVSGHPRPALGAHELRLAWQSTSLLLGYPDEALLARVPLVARGRRPAARVRGGSARRLPRPPGVDTAARAGHGVRRDVRPPATLLPLPDLRPARRHPAARRRAAAVQDGLPGRRRGAHRRGAAGPPRGRAGVRRHRGPRGRRGSCCWTTGPGWSCCGWP